MSFFRKRRQKKGYVPWYGKPALVVPTLVLGVLGVYLFVTAPPPLPEESEVVGGDELTVDVDLMLELVAMENATFRTLYTKDIVGPGLKQGLRYDENWLVEGAQTGPLPAVTLRAIAVRLDRSPVELGLFLGAEHAINRGNRFTGNQMEVFRGILADREPRFFYDDEQALHTAMFADIAVAEPCVTCHSEHPKTPKTDWELGDVMGATTWSYPRGRVTVEEVVQNLAELRKAFHDTYESYTDRSADFDLRPEVGDRWPSEGLYLPTAEVFMAEHARRASPKTVALLDAAWREAEASAD